ncbi:hypothetical protein AV954_gp36 [Escherichia phage SSL-2009a]|uniref:Uncharacterized protein n=1 Tax=Escherichia phage SSL-2009a TaxID=2681619 RepID=T2DRQ4_9CAUD|nr:hypothetical protein AV954_gp36 [Escherichia phage SSL-2009a]AGV55599.1 hypothetical protein [Escherichia phage SSL-2009a]
MKSLFFDYDGDLRFWVLLTLMIAGCIGIPSTAIYYTERYECKTVYAEQTGRNTQWRYGVCWVEIGGKLIPRNEIRTTEIK